VPAPDAMAIIDNAKVAQCLELFYDAVNDDLNMPRAVAAIWDILRDSSLSPQIRRACAEKAEEILALDLLAVPETVKETVLLSDGPKIVFDSQAALPEVLKTALVNKIKARRAARKEKNFMLSDEIRNALAAQNIIMKDMPDGSTECGVPVNVCNNFEEVLAAIEK